MGWPTTWAIAPRVLLGLKFLVVARVLGPQEFGQYALALIGLAVAEGLSEFGFKQAIVQGHEEPRADQLAEVMGLQWIRGIVLAASMASIASLLEGRLGYPAAASLAVVGCIPLLRGLGTVPVAILQRQLRYRELALLEVCWRVVELALAFAAAWIFRSSLAVVVSTLVAEFVGLAFSWRSSSASWRSAFPTTSIAAWTGYGRWIWGQSLLTVVLNQFDKFYVAGAFGSSALGGYQGVNRLLQLVLADPILMAANALFPRMARDAREYPDQAMKRSCKILHLGASVLAVVLLAIVLGKSVLVRLVLGERWSAASGYVPIFASTMALGAAITFFVTWYRSSGNPSVVVWATAAQIVAYGPLVWVLGRAHGAMGVALASNLALWIALLMLMLSFPRKSLLLSRIGLPGFCLAAILCLAVTSWPIPAIIGLTAIALVAVWFEARGVFSRAGWST